MAQTIGIKALRDALSSVVRSLVPGQTVDITDRGKVVAHLVATTSAPPSSFERLLDAGALRLPLRPAAPFAEWPPSGWDPLPRGAVRALLDAEREELDR